MRWKLIENSDDYPPLGEKVVILVDREDHASSPSIHYARYEEAPRNDLGLKNQFIDIETMKRIINVKVVAWRPLKEYEKYYPHPDELETVTKEKVPESEYTVNDVGSIRGQRT